MKKDEDKEPAGDDEARADDDDEQPLSPALPPARWLAGFSRRVQPYEIWLVIAACAALLVPGVWLYTLIDPWETHYAEVARRMLDEQDWVLLRWQNEIFQSKPVLTFWLIASVMKVSGVGALGGFSGEIAASPLVMFAVRIPFVLFAIGGMTALWWMLSKLISRRVAWLTILVLGTTPFYFMVARQAITDMPMVACLTGALACFAMAVHAGDEPLQPIFKWINAYHLFVAVLLLFVGGQLVYNGFYFFRSPQLAHGLKLSVPQLWATVPFWVGLAGFVGWSAWLQKTTTRRSVYMYWFFFLVGVSVLAKGPPGIGLAGLICFLYLLTTNGWRLLPFKLEIPRGILLAALVVMPWHVAMFLKAGRRWYNEYFVHHMIKRSLSGVHGDRGTFDYFASQLGIGMWPWIAILPAALATALATAKIESREGRVKLLVGIWAIAGFSLFAASQTKFHHYILPAVPALAILIALWLDDLWTGRARRIAMFGILGAAIVAFIARDMIGKQEQLIELFIYRYDRPWPKGPPWNLDVTGALWIFGTIGTLTLLSLTIARIRKYSLIALGLCAIGFAYWAMNGYMSAAGPHWGQRALHRTYFEQREVHGIEIKYFGLHELSRDWADGEYVVESVLPKDFEIGRSVRATLHVPAVGLPQDRIVLEGVVTGIGENRFLMTGTPPTDLAARFTELIERGKRSRPAPRREWVQVDADRLVAWQLNWRGENFWSAGEIYGETKDTQTVFMNTDNKAFLTYVKDVAKHGRKFFVITEAGRAAGLKGVLPTQRAKNTLQVLDTSCNKFTLLSFTL